MTWTERSNCLLAETPVLLRRNSTAISVKLRYLFGIISATLRRNATILSIRRRISDGCKPSDSCQKGINLTKTAHFPNVKTLSVLLTKGRRVIVIVNQSHRGCQERPKKCGDRPYLPVTTISHWQNSSLDVIIGTKRNILAINESKFLAGFVQLPKFL